MLWKTAEQISILSRFFELQPGDLIMTGTPSGVGPVKRGDKLEGHVAGVCNLKVNVI
jgi:fumarylpyruvate hydrolase